MEFFDWLSTLLDNGTVPSILAVILSIVATILEVTKNKIAKRLVASDDNVQKLEQEVQTLINLVTQLAELCSNTNAMTSAATDQLHMAFLNSKLSPATKLELQKVYDACPDAVSESAKSLSEVVSTPATKEQVKAIPDAETKSYADLISDKYSK
jgi:hypothetical protein